MKKILPVLILCLSLLLCGCGNEYAQKEYNATDKIANQGDRYSKVGSVFNPIDGGYSLEVSKFDGRETLWDQKYSEGKDIEIQMKLTLTAGKAKIVSIDEDDNVTTILECTPDSVESDYVTKTVSLTKGRNRIKIVGAGCKDVSFQMLSDEF